MTARRVTATATDGDGVAETYEERPRRRGRRWLVVLVVLVLILGGLLVVADRVAAGVAERAIADQVQQEVAKQDASSAADPRWTWVASRSSPRWSTAGTSGSPSC